MEKTYWLSYDLGIKGDYENLYSWLDEHNAMECGKGLAVLKFDGDINSIEAELSSRLDIKNGRIYLIWLEDGQVIGRFLFGKRTRSPWQGFGSFRNEFSETDVASA